MTQSERNTQSLRAARRGSQKLDMVWCGVRLAGGLVLTYSYFPDRKVYVHSVRPVFISRHTAYSEHVATFYIVIPSSSSRL